MPIPTSKNGAMLNFLVGIEHASHTAFLGLNSFNF